MAALKDLWPIFEDWPLQRDSIAKPQRIEIKMPKECPGLMDSRSTERDYGSGLFGFVLRAFVP